MSESATKQQEITVGTSLVTGPKNASTEVASFKLSVFRAIQLDAEVIKQLNRLLRTRCFEGVVSEPGQDQHVL